MRQRGYPTTDDVVAPPTGEDAARAILIATQAAEWLTSSCIRPQRVKVERLLFPNQYVLLDDFPIVNVRVDGVRPSAQFDGEGRLGMIVNLSAPTKEYEISYIRGFVEGQLPQIYGELIRKLASLHLGSDEESEEDVGMIAQACIRIRQQVERERKSL